MTQETSCSRRAFLARGAAALPLLASCASTDVVSPLAGDAVVVTADLVIVHLDRTPMLASAGGALVVYEAAMIIVRSTDDKYAALSNVCTHAGCGISQFVLGVLRCQCHGSEFTTLGAVVVGPAITPLKAYDVAHDVTSRLLRIRRV